MPTRGDVCGTKVIDTLAFARLESSNTNTVINITFDPISEGTNVVRISLFLTALVTRSHDGGNVFTREQVHAKDRLDASLLARSVS